MSDEMILSTSDQAASIKTVTGWVSRDGHFFGNGPEAERMARYRGCTHTPCQDCGEPAHKSRTVCSECSSKRQRARYEALPAAEWDGEPICLYDDNRFFFDIYDIILFCEDQELDPSQLMLTDTRAQGLSQVEHEHWCDDLPEDGELPAAVEEALAALNKVIRDTPATVYWMNGKKRIVLSEKVLAEFPAPEAQQD